MKRFLLITSGGVVLSLVGLAGCLSAMSDSPLGASGDQRGVAPGEAITGRVINPDGDIHVTLASAGVPEPRDGRNSPDALECAYGDGTYRCPTEGVPEGAHRVEVTDAKWPSEGVQLVEVIITSVEGYSPRIAVSDDKKSAILTGWAPGRAVTLTVINRNLARTVAGPVTGTPDTNGALTLPLEDVESGTYEFEATDGLWAPGDVDNGWDPLFFAL